MPKKKRSTLPADYLSSVLEAPDDGSDGGVTAGSPSDGLSSELPGDYLSAVVSESAGAEGVGARPSDYPVAVEVTPERPPPKPMEKARMSFHLPRELCETVRNTAWHLSKPRQRVTLSSLAEHGLQREIRRLERKHNDGEAFAPRPEKE